MIFKKLLSLTFGKVSTQQECKVSKVIVIVNRTVKATKPFESVMLMNIVPVGFQGFG